MIFGKNWWAKTRYPDMLFDMTAGNGVGYNAIGGDVDSVVNLVTLETVPASSQTLKATETTVGGLPAIAFAGGAVSRPYRGAISGLPAMRKRVSFHSVFTLGNATATQRPFTIGEAGLPASAKRIELQYQTSRLLSIAMAAPEISTSIDGCGELVPAADGDLVVMSIYVDAEAGEVTYYYAGAIVGTIRQDFDPSAYIGSAWDYVTIGGYDASSTHVLTGNFLVAAQFSGDDHTLAEARDIHRALIDRHLPDKVENVVLMQWLSQSNGDGNTAGTALNQVSFADGTAYKWNPSTKRILNTGVGHPAYPTATCNSPMYWFAKELQDRAAADGLAIKPIISINTAGGVPYSSSTLWTSSNAYLGIPDEEGDDAGKTSLFNTQRPFWATLADIVTHTPKWNVLGRLFFVQGFESDASAGVPYDKVRRTLADTWRGMKREFGFTHCLVIELGTQGQAPEATAVTAEPRHEAIRQAQRDFATAGDDRFMIYDHLRDHLPAYSSDGLYHEDNLVVDGNGFWISGAGYNNGPHYSTQQYRAIGLTGARNFWRLINGKF